MNEIGSIILVILLFIFLISLYFLPTIVAFMKRRRNRLPVFLLNLLLGWSFVGWVIALVWAANSDN